MKKLLPLIAGAMLCISNTADAYSIAELPGMRLTGVSPDGTWVAGSDENTGVFVIINLAADKEYWYGGEESDDPTIYSAGLGKFISNNGIVVASSQMPELPYYWEDGQWQLLPIKDTDYTAYPQAITPDGSRIAGSVAKSAMSLEATEVMTVPVVWNRNADGGYDMYVEIPHPTSDWTSRLPQYVLVDDISADGKVLAGDMVDYSGFVQQPIVFVEGDNGEWSYQLVHPELINPAAVEFPPYPGEAPEEPQITSFMTPQNADAYNQAYEEWISRPYPEQYDYMTEDEFDAYMAAMDAYYEDWENNPFPYADDFMTPEELEAYYNALNEYSEAPAPDAADYMTEDEVKEYEAAKAAWESAFEQWSIAYAAFDSVFWDAVVNPDAPTFTMNSARISPNGRYYIMNTEAYYIDPTSPMGISSASTPMLFDLKEDTYQTVEGGVRDILASQVFDNGAIIGGTPANEYTRSAALSKAAGQPFEFVSDIVKKSAPEIYTWMDGCMTHNIVKVDYVYNEETDEYEEVVTMGEQMITGTPVATADLKTLVTWAFNIWDDEGEDYYSYIFPLSVEYDGVMSINADNRNCSISLDRNGILTVNGDAANISIYDVNGREVYRTNANASSIRTGLGHGLYIIKATTADGKAIVNKAAI